MKTFTLKFASFVCVVLLFVTAITASSCKKDETCHGKVTVVDTAGVPVSGANLLLAAPSVNGDIKYGGVTDASGNASFEVKLPAIFDVTAKKDSKEGTGILRLDEPGKDASVIVTIK